MDNGQITKLTFEIEAAARKQKLGEYLFDNMRDLSKMYLRELIKTGKCEVNGYFVNSGYLLRENDFIELEADLSRGTAMRPEDVALDIIFEDAEMIVVNKPTGMLVHPSHRENNGTLMNALSFYLNANSPKLIRPGLPHRLDKQTSGLLVVAKTARAHRILSEHFMKKCVEKRYLALVDGLVEADDGSLNAPIGRFADLKYWGVKDDGKISETKFQVRERFADTTLLELEPVTGRTNQLRIHCEMIGHPIVGDIQRGGREFSRLCLHAWKLAFPHPITREVCYFEAPISFTP
ncbi:MAG: RluA family pseudouridine synthase [Chloracidobacterium sp.]|nr:RluA family pseudouridine synthase [Chloracidobacterium sp.]